MKTSSLNRNPMLKSTVSLQQLIGDDPSHDLRHLYNNLKIYETRLELAADAAGAGLWSLDLGTYLFWANAKTYDIFNFPKTGKIAFEDFMVRVHPDDSQVIQDVVHKVVHEGGGINVEYRVSFPDGSVRWVHSRGALHNDVAGGAPCIMGLSVDITDRKMSELTTARQLQFEALLASISTAFARFLLPADLDDLIEEALCKLLNYFGGDRCGLIKLDPVSRKSLITHAYYREGLEKVPVDADLATLFPWTFDNSCAGKIIKFSHLDELPPAADTDRQSWLAMGVKSGLNIPLLVEENFCYLLLVQSLSGNISWTLEALPRLQMFGEVFTNAIYKKTVEQELRTSYNEIIALKDKLEVEAEYLRAEVRAFQSHDEIIGQSEPLMRVLSMIKQVAVTSSTVLVCGETGTGKELVAQAIHNNSPRRKSMMVKVNCASLPSSLVESELFGREKGAYTGALTRQMGRFELADGSTLFLDEISELSLELQAKLLRVLQEGEFERLGSPRTIKVDVRLIAATNRNLLEEVKKGLFREDLYYRLNVFPLNVPPLRDRLEDIPMLVWEFVREFNEKMGKKIHKVSPKVMSSLLAYKWPGNIRELRNVIEYASIVSPGDELKVRLPEFNTDESLSVMTLETMESRYIEAVLIKTGWRIKGENGAARILDMNPATLYSRMKKLGISPPREKDGM